jgi:hypothetical protein
VWTGWVLPRLGANWLRLSTGPTLEVCHKQLLARVKRLGLQGGWRLMTGGQHPAAVLSGRDHDAPAAGPPR